MSHNRCKTAHPFVSEEIEPIAAKVVGRLFARYDWAKKHAPDEAEGALNSLWWAVNALNSLSVAIGTATHFSIATNNEVIRVAALIRAELDIDPYEAPMWKWR